MHWIFWLALAVVLAAFAALTGVKPSDTKPVARTSLMHAGRIVLLIAAALVAVFALISAFAAA